MKILTIVGARPQIIKASVLSRAIQKTDGIEEIMLHTGQHFDANMSDIFFTQMLIPRPNHFLDIHGLNHGAMTGQMLEKIETVILREQPDRVMVYGDTNSTLAGALAAAKLNIPVAHVEAGLRSFNMQMPEEVNRILTDRVSDLLFCPTEAAVKNLKKEGFVQTAQTNCPRVFKVGDVMQDAAMMFSEFAKQPEQCKGSSGFVLCTLHRAENTDDFDRLSAIVAALNDIDANIAPLIFPLHPRTRKAIEKTGLELKFITLNPVGYLEMLWLLKHCKLVLTDSGGLQKEAFFFGKACVTMRDETEWVELVECCANELIGADKEQIVAAVSRNLDRKVEDLDRLYGGGSAANQIVKVLAASHPSN